MTFDKLIRLVFSLLMVATLVCASPTEAGDVYVSAALNRSYVDDHIDVDGNDVLLDGDASGMRLALGYAFNDYFATELAYADFGDLSQSAFGFSLFAEADALELAVLGRLPLGERFALFGRLGYVDWDGNTGVDGVTVGTSGNDVSIGAGFEFVAGESLSFSLEGTRYRLDDLDFAVVGAGIRFRF